MQLPQDALQPWELPDRSSSGIDAGSEFTAGRDWFSGTIGGISENGEAARLQSTAGQSSHGIWRIPMGGEQPATLSADVNLLDRGDGSPSSYYIGLADFGNGRWDWRGPFTDSHVRISLAEEISSGGNFLSSVNSVFASILVWNGAAVDVVGLGLNPFDGNDPDAPPQPAGLTASPSSGGLELLWNPVIASDLAGYLIHYSNSGFMNPYSAGVKTVPYLEGSTHHVISGLSGRTFVRVSAIDHSGNRSPASELVSAVVPAGVAPGLLVLADSPSGSLGSQINISASGAQSYDIDADGDGIFELTGQASANVAVDTSRSGIIRPRVRGVDGEAVALGSVSLVVSGNSRPVAVANADPATGPAPLVVSFSGADSTDFDGSIAGGGWDFEGDGIYDEFDETDTIHIDSSEHTYTEPGVYNAKLRVLDDGGAWDVDTVSIVVTDPGSNVVASLDSDISSGPEPLVVSLNAAGSTGDAPLKFYWDFEGDGSIDLVDFDGMESHTYTEAGSYTATCTVEDADGDIDTDTLEITVTPDPNIPPVAELTADRTQGYAPFVINFDASASSDSDGSIELYEWDFDNNGTWDSYSTSGTEQHTYPVRGNYTCRVRVTDNDGDSDEASIELHLPSAASQFHMGPSMNRSSPFNGPQTNNIDWWLSLGSAAGYSTPAIGPDGTIYVGGGDGYVYAVTPGGDYKWDFLMGFSAVWGSPAIADDGLVLIGGLNGDLIAINPGGNERWRFDTASRIDSSPAIGPDGTIYFGCNDDNVYAVTADGKLKWKFSTGGDIFSSPAIGPDGTVYCGSDDGKLYGIDSSGSELFNVEMGGLVRCSPAIGPDGRVYIGSDFGAFYCLNADGTVSWGAVLPNSIRSTPVIDASSNVYFGCDDGFLYKYTNDGLEDWSYPTFNLVRSSPVIAADGTIYFCGHAGTMLALNPDGSEKWTEGFIGTVIYSSPVLSADGTMYITDNNGRLLAYRDES